MNPSTTQASSTYDKAPVTRLGPEHHAWRGRAGWDVVREHVGEHGSEAVVVIDTYPGVDVEALVAEVVQALPGFRVVDVEDAAARPREELDALMAPWLTDDRVFGRISDLVLTDLYDPAELERLADQVHSAQRPVVLVGWGASLVPVRADVLVLADLARWEIQRRQRAGMPTWRGEDGDEDRLLKYKRGYFVEWRVADAHKRTLVPRVDFLLDTNDSVAEAKIVTGGTFRAALAQVVTGPFRVVPFFDPGVWGGQWMRDVCGLDPAEPNYAWCFDCVPEENSLLLGVGDEVVEIPSIDVVHTHPEELLGAGVRARFGAEFPIRFDLLDTMGGGNLSLQVHPRTEYIREVFGMGFTQDESYYLLDAEDDAVVYLGLREDADPQRVLDGLAAAQAGSGFDAPAHVNTFPARTHDHFLIPAGTVHCSGAGSMVLEISATPFIFTFKLWDWGRLGLDGRPRPIHLEHAAQNIAWERRTGWVEDNLVGQVQEVARGEGWVEERTGLHGLEFIETRRHWFTAAVDHDTGGTVNVLNLVEGAEAVVESPSGAFAPFVVHYAETFIVPAAVGRYTVRPHGAGEGQRLATIKAFVRETLSDGID